MNIELHSVPLDSKKFEKKHLDLSLVYVNNTIAYPHLYNNQVIQEKFPGMKYVGRKIVDIKDIDISPDEKLLEGLPEGTKNLLRLNKTVSLIQSPRANGRGQNSQEVWQEMQTFGYELEHIPGSICKLPSGRNHIMNSRTRLEELIRQGFENVILDCYECDNYHSFNKFSLFLNRRPAPCSPTKMKDIVAMAMEEVEAGRLKYTQGEIENFVDIVSGGKFPAGRDKIISRIKKMDETTSLTFTDTEAKMWLNEHGYHDNKNNNGIYYLVVSRESAGSSFLNAAKELKKLKEKNKNFKELRLVINPGYLEAASAPNSWMKTADKFRENHKTNLSLIESAYFNKPKHTNEIVLYGIIPTVRALAQKYPLDTLVTFVSDKGIESKPLLETLSEEKMENIFYS